MGFFSRLGLTSYCNITSWFTIALAEIRFNQTDFKRKGGQQAVQQPRRRKKTKNKTTTTKTKQLFLVPADALQAEKLTLGYSFLTTIGVRECVIQVRMSVSWFLMYPCVLLDQRGSDCVQVRGNQFCWAIACGDDRPARITRLVNIWQIESWRARIIHNEIYGLFLSFTFQDSRLNDPANRVVFVYNVVPVLLLVEVVIREFSFWLFYIKMSTKQPPLLPVSAGMMMISLRCYQPGNRLSVWEKGEKITRRKQRCKSNLSSVSVLADRSLYQDPMHSEFRGTTVPMFVYRLSPFSFPLFAIFSPFPQTENLLTGYVAIMITGGLSLVE